MKNKKFGFEFWKGIAEVTGYSFIGFQIPSSNNIVKIGAFAIIMCFMLMMIISEFKENR